MSYLLSNVANNEYKEFAIYTVENRAIPSVIDGLKPSQRFYLYSSIVNSKVNFKKVSAIAGVVSTYGYQHGEASAIEAGAKMAADWSNNICLVEGQGNFGNRAVQKFGAARYIYTRVHPNFSSYFRDIDLSLVKEHNDPECAVPNFYIPVVPMVLVNGSRGIAVGFSSNILPRSLTSVVKACKEYIRTANIKNKIDVCFPYFTGSTVWNPTTNQYISTGRWHKRSKTMLEIVEIPYEYDNAEYRTILNKMEEDKKIVSYVDKTRGNQFCFDVKLNKISSKWDEQQILHNFKLIKTSTEILNVIGVDGRLYEYSDEREIIKAFVDYKLNVLQTRIIQEKNKCVKLCHWLKVKREFIMAVLNSQIVFKNKDKAGISAQILKHTSANKTDIDRLLELNLSTLTAEKIMELENQIAKNLQKIVYWDNTTPNQQFLDDLVDL